ncbi:MAG: hypothetical protein JWN76_1689 [Chitinophagaceae bacterium]|nr:hypothetical protein [Chitinophagaceae bacterium]
MPDEESFVEIDKEKIWRVISNLVVNAIKFSPRGACINVSVTRNGKRTIITVSDQGIGIPENIRMQVFDMFTEAKRPGTSGEKSFGLGLFISRQIVQAHKGRLWFESAENKGTNFYIELQCVA